MKAADFLGTSEQGDNSTSRSLNSHLVSLSPCLLVFLACLAVYARTAAPGVMGGDSAEFQMAAPLLGVPHPTTYPLYILLGKLFTLIVPFGDLARRVTLVSVFSAALAVALMFLLARRITGSALAAGLGALTLAVAPGLWNAATMAEVYGLLAALLTASWLGIEALGRKSDGDAGWVGAVLVAFLSGLGVSHHGLFAFTMLPVTALSLFRFSIARAPTRDEQPTSGKVFLTRLLLCSIAFLCGLTPWLFPLVQYARFGPFIGEDYGLPRFYFWGAPTTWAEALGMVSGGPMRGGVFRVPTGEQVVAVLRLVLERVWFEFGPIGTGLGVIGVAALWKHNRRVWLNSAWIVCGTLFYLLLLGPAVQDAPIFTLPLLLPWALWVGVGGQACVSLLRQEDRKARIQEEHATLLAFLSSCFLVFFLAATLGWGYTRLPYANKRHLNIWREWGQRTLAQLPPNAVVIAHWEQGMVLQYLVRAEQQRLDLWIDVVEPTDDRWGPRAERRYTGRPVYFVGSTEDIVGISTKLVRPDSYADLFVLHRP